MKKIRILFVILSICLFSLCGCNDSNNNPDNLGTERTNYSTALPSVSPSPREEIEVSSFTTNILDKTPNRIDNITLTCSKINEITVKNGETFSFCDTVGEVSSATGYKEADILDKNGKPFKGYGGGSCQVSSTLYNAVLEIDNIKILERHEHSKRVYYVDKDKDAAVDFPSKLDFRFKNNTGNDIKIYASNTNEDVTVKIMRLE